VACLQFVVGKHLQLNLHVVPFALKTKMICCLRWMW
jgi:hypothetical protein